MNVLLKNSVTGEYLGERNRWLTGEAEAKVFPSTWAAADYVVDNAISHCQTVLKLRQPMTSGNSTTPGFPSRPVTSISCS